MAKSSEKSTMQVQGMQACRCPANLEHSPFEHGMLHVKDKQSALHPADTLSAVSTMDTMPTADMLSAVSTMESMPTTSDLASSNDLDALDLDLKASFHRDLTETHLYSSLDLDLGMDEGRHCDISYNDSVFDYSDVHGDPLLGDPLLGELPSEYSGKNRSPFPHAKLMWQKQSVNVGAVQGASIPWQRSKRMMRVADLTSPLRSQDLDMLGGDVFTPRQEPAAELESFQKCLTRKYLPLTPFFGEERVGHAPVSTSQAGLNSDMFGKAEVEETLKLQNVDTVGSGLHVTFQEHKADMASLVNDALDLDFEDSLHRDLTKTDLYTSLDFDLGMDEGRHCDISYDDSVSDCSDVLGDPLLGDPLLSELPSEYSGKNGSPSPQAKLMWQKKDQDAGRQQEASISLRRRMVRVEDFTSQAELQWDLLFGKAEVEEAQNVDMVGSKIHVPLHVTWKDLPLAHSFAEDDVALHAPDSDLKFDVFVKAEAEESSRAQNVNIDSDLKFDVFGKAEAQSCDKEGVKMHVLAGAPVLALRRKRLGA